MMIKLKLSSRSERTPNYIRSPCKNVMKSTINSHFLLHLIRIVVLSDVCGTQKESLAALKKYVAIGKDTPLFILANVLLPAEKQNNKRRSCNCNNFPSLSFSLMLETILGRSRLGICCYGVGSSLFMAFYNSIAFWHVLNSLRSSSIVSWIFNNQGLLLIRKMLQCFSLSFISFLVYRYDDTRPIDIQYSIIAQKLFNITVKEH